jgi:two-component system chemotaxis sensor kinase CheA
VRLSPDAALGSARALLITRSALQSRNAIASEPAEFGEAFAGEFTLVLAPDGDAEALERLVSGAGDVESIEWEVAAEPAAEVAPAPEKRPERQVRVDADRLDVLADAVGELAILHARLESSVPEGAADSAMNRMGTLLAELQQATLALRMVPVATMFDRFPRLVRDAARRLGKQIELRMAGGDIELDRALLEEISEPLVHLVRNAVDHGVEEAAVRERQGKPAVATVHLRAVRERGGVRIEVADDGGGIDPTRVLERARTLGLPGASTAEPRNEDLLRIMSEPGFSTADGVSDLSGRGVGLDVVVTKVRSLGGAIELSTRPGVGTTFALRLPITLALTPALRVRVAGGDYAVPLTHLAEVIDLRDHVAVLKDGLETVMLRDASLPLFRMRELLGMSATGTETAAIVAEIGERRAALAVDALVGREPILVRAFDAPAGAHAVFAGAALLGDGRPTLVLDPASVV